MYDGLAHGLPFISSKIGFFEEFSDMGLGILVKRNPIEFSQTLLKIEIDYNKYKDAVINFRKSLLWKEVAKKHILLYNSMINPPNSPVIKKITT
jgi:hypothetical protein